MQRLQFVCAFKRSVMKINGSFFLKQREINLYNKKYLSRRTIIILLAIRVFMKIYLLLLGLYLIVNFAEFITKIIMH